MLLDHDLKFEISSFLINQIDFNLFLKIRWFKHLKAISRFFYFNYICESIIKFLTLFWSEFCWFLRGLLKKSKSYIFSLKKILLVSLQERTAWLAYKHYSIWTSRITVIFRLPTSNAHALKLQKLENPKVAPENYRNLYVNSDYFQRKKARKKSTKFYKRQRRILALQKQFFWKSRIGKEDIEKTKLAKNERKMEPLKYEKHFFENLYWRGSNR